MPPQRPQSCDVHTLCGVPKPPDAEVSLPGATTFVCAELDEFNTGCRAHCGWCPRAKPAGQPSPLEPGSQGPDHRQLLHRECGVCTTRRDVVGSFCRALLSPHLRTGCAHSHGRGFPPVTCHHDPDKSPLNFRLVLNFPTSLHNEAIDVQTVQFWAESGVQCLSR